MKSKKPDLKEQGIISAAILFIITLIVTVLLATVNHLTAPVIAQHNEEESDIAHEHVFPSASSFNDLSIEIITEEDTQIVSVYDALDENGELLGVVVEALASGYGGDIKIMVGITKDMDIAGLEVLSNSETPGLGTKVTGENFRNSFIGKEPGRSFVLGSGDNDQNGVDGITGATISSKAMIKGVNTALDFAQRALEDILSGGNTDG